MPPSFLIPFLVYLPSFFLKAVKTNCAINKLKLYSVFQVWKWWMFDVFLQILLKKISLSSYQVWYELPVISSISLALMSNGVVKLEFLSIYISINLGTIFDFRLYIMNEYHMIYFPNVCSDSKQALHFRCAIHSSTAVSTLL